MTLQQLKNIISEAQKQTNREYLKYYNNGDRLVWFIFNGLDNILVKVIDQIDKEIEKENDKQ